MHQLIVLALLVLATSALPATPTTSLEKQQDPVFLEVCFSSREEESICTDLANATRKNPTIRFLCNYANSSEECFHLFRDNSVNITSPKPAVAFTSIRRFQIQPVLKEFENNSKTIGVAIVRKSSHVTSWGNFNFSSSCQTNSYFSSIWFIDVLDSVLIDIMGKNKCPFAERISRSILFDEQVTPNPLECLTSGKGDVAFMDYESAKKALSDGKLKPADFELLCKEGGRKPFDQFTSCNLGAALPTVMNSSDVSPEKKTKIESAVNVGLKYFSKHLTFFDTICFYQNNVDHFPSQTKAAEKVLTLEEHLLKDTQIFPTLM